MGKRMDEAKNILKWDANAIAEFLEELKGEINGIKKTNELDVRISNLIRNLGIPFHLRGVKYLKIILMYYVPQKGFGLNGISITKVVYPMIARKCNTTIGSVERGIRYVCEYMMTNAHKISEVYKVFGDSIRDDRGRPTNSEFIAGLVDYMISGRDLK